MTKKLLTLLLLISSYLSVFSQAGYGVYQFLDLPLSSRITALGGMNVSLRDNDVSMAFDNPALLTPETHNVLGLSMANYLADIKFGSAIYGRNFGDKNYFAVGVQYVDYGSFKEVTDVNVVTGRTFTAKDMALNIIYARPLTKTISVGANLKPINSVYESYTSFGMALDAGINYHDEAKNLSAGLTIRNIGTQFSGYYSDGSEQHYEPLPINVVMGVSKKFEHAPLRLSMTLHNLQAWNLKYQSTNQESGSLTNSGTTTSGSSSGSISAIDMAFRHSIWSAEFIPTKNFYLVASYNHRRHQEMSMNGFKSMAGFSFGGGLKIYKFHVGFGWSQFTVGNNIFHFSINTALNEFRL